MADNMGEHLLNRINFPADLHQLSEEQLPEVCAELRQYPADLHQLSEEQLPEVCAELRQYIIDVLSENPGHLGASLGTVELTVALHYVFNAPYDRIVWDVGHQAYGGSVDFPIRQKASTTRSLPDMHPIPSRRRWGWRWLRP